MLRSSWVAAQLAASEEGLNSMSDDECEVFRINHKVRLSPLSTAATAGLL
jgi:hypothetical protein